MNMIKDSKVALKFKSDIFKEKVRYETRGKIKQRVSFPAPQTTDFAYILITGIDLIDVSTDGIMDLSFFTEKASYMISGEIKNMPLSEKPAIIKLTPQGELRLISGEPVKGAIQGTLIFPQRFLSVGDFWETPMKIELPYFSKPFDFMARSSLENFEPYGDNKICAVINTLFYCSEERPSGKFQGKETLYFDYELGKLVKSVFNMRIISNIFSITLDLNVITNLLETTS